jgi:hypothetical protein
MAGGVQKNKRKKKAGGGTSSGDAIKEGERNMKMQKLAERRKKAADQITDGNKRQKDGKAKKRRLERILRTQSEPEQEETKKQLQELEQEMQGIELEIKKAIQEESLAKDEEGNIDMGDDTQGQGNNGEQEGRDGNSEQEQENNGKQEGRGGNSEQEQENNDDQEGPDKEQENNGDQEGLDDEQESNGSDDSDGKDDSDEEDEDEEDEEKEYPNLMNHEEMKKVFGIASGVCKGWTKVGASGKRPVVQLGPRNSPTFRTMKSSQFKGVINPSSDFNLVKQRRCDVRNEDDTKKFTLDDVDYPQGISYYVPDGYEGNPAERLKPLPPRLTKKQKDAMKDSGEQIPDEPKPETVQVFLKWKKPYKGKTWSAETRSGIRGLYGDNAKGDKFIYKAALIQEERYQKYLDGKRPAKDQSASPFPPGKENTPPGDSGKKPEDKKPEEKKPEEKKPEEKKPEEKKPEGKKPEGKKPEERNNMESKTAYKAGLKEFESKFRMLEDIEDDIKLTPTQKGEMIEAFDGYWAKKQAK